VFSDICKVLGDVLKSNVIVISRTGKILGISKDSEIEELTQYLGSSVGEYVDSELNERLLEILSTKENVNLMTLGFECSEEQQYHAIITPIDIAGQRLGTMFIYRNEKQYGIDDIILSEYGNTVVGLEMTRSLNEESENLARRKNLVEGAMNSLSLSERKAVGSVLGELNAREGILVASKVAQKAGITRSVIVNAIRKLESAGIIETHSNGMKGTYIKVVIDDVYEWLDNMEVAQSGQN
jgi:transcriptional pleiotropic repressor